MTSKVTLTEAFCSNEQHVRCSWVNVVDIMFHELTGINSIMIFSNTILSTITDGGLSPRAGTILIGGVNFFSSAVSFLIVR
jgi:hypothetical protein